MMTSSSAWLLIPNGLQPFAVAEHEVIEYLNRIEPRDVPCTPTYCPSVLFWRDHIIPLMELGALTGYCSENQERQAVVLAYQLEPATPLQYVAIALQAPPTRIAVTDDMACDLPETHVELWQRLAKSCFEKDGIATPIISIAWLCSAAFRLGLENIIDNIFCKDHDRVETETIAGPNSAPRKLEETIIDDKGFDQNCHTQKASFDSHVVEQDANFQTALGSEPLAHRTRDDFDMDGEDAFDLEREDFDDWHLENDNNDMDDFDEMEDSFEDLDAIDELMDALNDDSEDIDAIDLDDDLDDGIDLEDLSLEDDDSDFDGIDDLLEDFDDFDDDLDDDFDLEGSDMILKSSNGKNLEDEENEDIEDFDIV